MSFYKNFVAQWTKKREKDEWEISIYGSADLRKDQGLVSQLLDKLGEEFPTECKDFSARLFAANEEISEEALRGLFRKADLHFQRVDLISEDQLIDPNTVYKVKSAEETSK
jgi:hypothetical protein